MYLKPADGFFRCFLRKWLGLWSSLFSKITRSRVDLSSLPQVPPPPPSQSESPGAFLGGDYANSARTGRISVWQPCESKLACRHSVPPSSKIGLCSAASHQSNVLLVRIRRHGYELPPVCKASDLLLLFPQDWLWKWTLHFSSSSLVLLSLPLTPSFCAFL